MHLFTFAGMKWLPEYFNDIGFAITFLGFLITIIQISIIKRRQKVIDEATTKAITRINHNNILLYLGSSTGIVNEIKQHVISKNYHAASDKVINVKEGLIQCRDANILPQHKAYLIGLLFRISSQQVLLNGVLLNNKNTVNFKELLDLLDDINTIFAEAISACKNKL